MATIKEMVSRLWRRLDGGEPTDDSKFTYRELKGYIISGIAQSLKANYYESNNGGEEFKYGSDNISITTKQTVKLDAETGLKYIEVPTETIAVAGNRQTSITSLNPVSRYATTFVPVRNEEKSVARMQPAIPCVVLYYREDKKLFFYNNEVADTTVKLNQKYAIPNDDNAEITMPADAENGVIATAMQIMGVVVAADKDNNGTSNI